MVRFFEGLPSEEVDIFVYGAKVQGNLPEVVFGLVKRWGFQGYGRFIQTVKVREGSKLESIKIRQAQLLVEWFTRCIGMVELYGGH